MVFLSPSPMAGCSWQISPPAPLPWHSPRSSRSGGLDGQDPQPVGCVFQGLESQLVGLVISGHGEDGCRGLVSGMRTQDSCRNTGGGGQRAVIKADRGRAQGLAYTRARGGAGKESGRIVTAGRGVGGAVWRK